MFNEAKLDSVREVINIGIGEAADSLSKLVNTPVIIKIPDIYVIKQAEIYEFFQKELKTIGVYISQDFTGIGKGKTFLFYSTEASISLLKNICGEITDESCLTENEINTLNEIGNIIIGSCMCKMADVLQSKIEFELPQVIINEPENYFENILDGPKEASRAIVIKNEITVRGTDTQGYIFVVLSFDKFDMVLDSLMKSTK
ncbi:chemotaxis protein CheC [Desulfobacterales bacterium HSG16]|nr:chemotaxis protein CheC [Desulfobacterales bacterium HSG16]